MSVDTGWPRFDGRDADRIHEVAKLAGVARIDRLVVTHFHGDHASGIAQLERIGNSRKHSGGTGSGRVDVNPLCDVRSRGPLLRAFSSSLGTASR